jgi:hypothetical protein
MVLAAGFACIPLAGLIGCRLTHGPFLDRYFLSSIAGYAIVAGFAASSHYCNAESHGRMYVSASACRYGEHVFLHHVE